MKAEELKATDLRIGNLVTDEFYDSFNTIYVVASINELGINLEIEDDGNFVEIAKIWINPEHTFDLLFGIPLTEEWFKQNNIFHSFEFAEVFTCYFFDGSVWIEEYGEGMYELKHIKYVHQYQNLYKLLTNEELTIN